MNPEEPQFNTPLPPTPPPPLEPPPPEPAPEPSNWQRLGSGTLSASKAILGWAVLPIAIVLLLHSFVFQAFRVVGHSMVPTLQQEDYLIVSKMGASVARAGGRSEGYIPARGEVIIFRYPKNPELVFVKRVIGLPGERVVIKNGKVSVYPEGTSSPLNPDEGTPLEGTLTAGSLDEIVPEHQLFVLGDNRSLSGSFDSREWGFLPSHDIIGKAVIRLLPLDQFRLFSALGL